MRMLNLNLPNKVRPLLRLAVEGVTKKLLAIQAEKWRQFPFGLKPRADEASYLKLYSDEVARDYSAIKAYELSVGYSIDRNWFNSLGLQTNIVIKEGLSTTFAHGRVLYSSVRAYIAKHTTSSTTKIRIFETGTARGFSAVCMAKALEDSDCFGTIYTTDVLPGDVPMYWNSICDTDGKPKTRRELLYPWKSLADRYIEFICTNTRIDLCPVFIPDIDIAFLDGAHEYVDIRHEFEFVNKRLTFGGLIIFDDYNPEKYPGICRAVDEIVAVGDFSVRKIPLLENRSVVILEKSDAGS